MIALLFGKIIFLFIAILYTVVNGSRIIRGQHVPAANMITMAAGITGFITLMWLI